MIYIHFFRDFIIKCSTHYKHEPTKIWASNWKRNRKIFITKWSHSSYFKEYQKIFPVKQPSFFKICPIFFVNKTQTIILMFLTSLKLHCFLFHPVKHPKFSVKISQIFHKYIKRLIEFKTETLQHIFF